MKGANDITIETANGVITLGRELFWDISEDDIEKALLESDEWVIPRVLEYGTLEEIGEIIGYYGRARVTDIVLKIELKPMSKAMVWYFLDLSVE